jgi:hypothetical protein
VARSLSSRSARWTSASARPRPGGRPATSRSASVSARLTSPAAARFSISARAPVRVVRLLGRCQPETVPGELGGDVGCAATPRPLGGPFQQLGGGGVHLVRREGEVPCPDVRVRGSGGQARMQRAPRERAQPAVYRRLSPPRASGG